MKLPRNLAPLTRVLYALVGLGFIVLGLWTGSGNVALAVALGFLGGLVVAEGAAGF